MQLTRRAATKVFLAGAAGGWAASPAGRRGWALAESAAQERLSTQVCVVGGGSGGRGAIVGIAPRLGVRESRRILGDYVLSEHDCLAGVKQQTHRDVIAITDHAVDIHGRKSRLYEVPHGPYGIPYRCLLPRGVQNLYAASRAASFSHIAASSCRLCRTMMTRGQAAGNAAALAVEHRIPTRQVDIRRVQRMLEEQGVAVTA